ncbi:unnamed protein product [Leptosia nina]|uniref:Fanconi anemia group M protein n=1 Tax=Leptosia nina TaxID=320188 RepID=A0AAV1JBN3_9NEOP
MNKSLNKIENKEFEEDEIFDDSNLLANFETSEFKDNSFDENSNKNALNVSALCCDEEISGYDRLTGKTWIYPTNYPVRDYQFNIIHAAIVKNTLVSLPTGLGKTFIAAVIMYNFYRWYPLGKIVFTAPTRPLVAQQIEACYNIVALPQKDTIEMTGHMQVNSRKQHWQTKRVFFATPQVIYNDIKSGICPGDKIRCLVVDEAHRARGNYAYCQIVSTLSDMGHKSYRVVALSATPGSKIEDVINVVKNLNIAHLELRTENCIDVAPYSHSRKVNTVVIKLGPELTHLRQQYVDILDGYARRLKQLNILPHNLGNLSKGRVVMMYKEFQNRDRSNRHPQHNIIMKDFTLLIALYHGLELLMKHGSRVFLNFFDEHPEKSWIQGDDKLTSLLERLRDDLGINPLSLDRSILPDGSVPEIPKDLCFGHPKFYKLKEIMLEHFQKAKKDRTKHKSYSHTAFNCCRFYIVAVFCEYRESVNLVHCLLLQCRPLIVPLMFVGQGASGKDGKTVVSQKQQLRVMRSFREGTCNTLVCTCVAEEGLDVGSVDLILCFDISTRSPIRLVQRCGRTGRERGGQVHILVTEGREHQTLIDCMRQRDGLNNRILQSKEVENNLYKANPRMIPYDFTPACQKMHITVPKKQDSNADKSKKGQKDLRNMLDSTASTSKTSFTKYVEGSELISEEKFNDLFKEGFKSFRRLRDPLEYWTMGKDALIKISKQVDNYLQLHTWLEWQRSLHTKINIGSSTDTEILTSLLKYGDNKRFDVPPSTQNPNFNTQDFHTQDPICKVSSPVNAKPIKNKVKASRTKSPIKKDGDIRALFSTTTKSTKDYTKLLNDLGINNDGSLPTSLINLLVDLKLEVSNVAKKCYICSNICDCKFIASKKNVEFKPVLSLSNALNLPDIDIIDDINFSSILKCSKAVTNEKMEMNYSVDNNEHNRSTNFNLEFDFDLSNSPEKEIATEPKENKETNFDIGNLDDIFENSSPEEPKDSVNSKQNDDPKETLGFFGLDSIDDIFADSDEDLNHKNDNNPIMDHAVQNRNDKIEIESDDDLIICDKYIDIQANTPLRKSPSILSGQIKENILTSPILCSQSRKFVLSTKKSKLKSSTPISTVRKKLMSEPDIHVGSEKTLLTEVSKTKQYFTENMLETSVNKSMFTITQLVEMINKSENSISANKSQYNNNDRSVSPILLTQADRKSLSRASNTKKPNKSISKSESLIILETDSESDEQTQEYDTENINKSTNNVANVKPHNTIEKLDIHKNTSSFNNDKKEANISNKTSPTDIHHTPNDSPKTSKRKFNDDDEIVSSPYFNKKSKIEEQNTKSLSLREKVLAALSSNKLNLNSEIDKSVNFVLHSSQFLSQKENKSPNSPASPFQDRYDDNIHKIKSSLQMFRRDSSVISRKIDFVSSPKCNSVTNGWSEDSDDDFVSTKHGKSQKVQRKNAFNYKAPNYKIRKKKKKPNQFLDLEAELSSDAESGDELSDNDSVGSLAEFIDDDANTPVESDMQAHYLQSVKSPVNGIFKIPQLPKKHNNEDILSQFVEEDNYEMDSFCVDSHIGLTQVNDVSELEVAEMILEEKRRKRKIKHNDSELNTADSPIVRRRKKCKRQINSDSDGSN